MALHRRKISLHACGVLTAYGPNPASVIIPEAVNSAKDSGTPWSDTRHA